MERECSAGLVVEKPSAVGWKVEAIVGCYGEGRTDGTSRKAGHQTHSLGRK